MSNTLLESVQLYASLFNAKLSMSVEQTQSTPVVCQSVFKTPTQNIIASNIKLLKFICKTLIFSAQAKHNCQSSEKFVCKTLSINVPHTTLILDFQFQTFCKAAYRQCPLKLIAKINIKAKFTLPWPQLQYILAHFQYNSVKYRD